MNFHHLIPTHLNINFIGKFKYFVVFSVLTLIGTLVLIFTKGFNFGIDFTGGTVVQVQYAQPVEPHAVRQLLAELKQPEASVVELGKNHQEYLITVRGHAEGAKGGELGTQLVQHVGADKIKILQSDHVGPKVGQELKWAAVQSLVFSILLIMIYIWFRFDFRFAPGATAAMVHDLTLAAGFFLITGKEFTITSVAALLTIAGYSVNDTIVVYDRVREMLKTGGNAVPLAQVINQAINLTLSRTILTSLVTLVSVLPIAFLCEGDIANFAECMVAGIFVGCYSTIYIAAPLTIYVERFMEKRNKGKQNKPRIATV